MGQAGRRHRLRRRRHCRDRDRQGDDGSRSRRRGHARQDPGRGGHRRRAGQHADRPAAGRGRGRERAGGRRRRRAAHSPLRKSRRRATRRRAPATTPASSGGDGATSPHAASRPKARFIPNPRTTSARSARRSRRAPRWCRPRCARRCATPWPRSCAATRRLRHGRGGRRVPGRLQDHAGPARRIRRPTRRRHADHRARLCRSGRRRGVWRPAADRRIHDLQLRHAGDRPDHQFGGQDALHGRRPDGLPDRVPRPERRRGARRRPAQPGLCRLVQPHPGPEGRAALYGGRRQGSAEVGDP